jgi:hydroxyquinol 1,2-dioxygenase
LHFTIHADGLDLLTTHLFVLGSEHIEDDVAFGVRPSLIADFARREPGRAPDGRRMNVPFRVLEYNFVQLSGRYAVIEAYPSA